jgi:hypothetical protein
MSEPFKEGEIVRYGKSLWRIDNFGEETWNSGLVMIANEFDVKVVPRTSLRRVKKQ